MFHDVKGAEGVFSAHVSAYDIFRVSKEWENYTATYTWYHKETVVELSSYGTKLKIKWKAS